MQKSRREKEIKQIGRDWPVRIWPTESNLNGPMGGKKFTHASNNDKCLTRTEVISQTSGSRAFSIDVNLHYFLTIESHTYFQYYTVDFNLHSSVFMSFFYFILLPARLPSHAHGYNFLQRLISISSIKTNFVKMVAICL